MTDRAKLMNTYAAEQFAAWELHLFLDTHPGDKAANRMLERHQARAAELREEYEKKFGPLTIASGEGCDWLKDPWPWEKGACV